MLLKRFKEVAKCDSPILLSYEMVKKLDMGKGVVKFRNLA